MLQKYNWIVFLAEIPALLPTLIKRQKKDERVLGQEIINNLFAVPIAYVVLQSIHCNKLQLLISLCRTKNQILCGQKMLTEVSLQICN